MVVTLVQVQVQVKAEFIDAFINATRLNHEASIAEPGNLRFDVLQQSDDPGRFILYEAYVDAASAAAHKQTVHYLAWRNAVRDWMDEPRTGTDYTGLFPAVS